MTFRCSWHNDRGADWLRAVGLSFLLGLCAFTTGGAWADDDGTRLPPRPSIKHKQKITEDAQFESPLKRGLGEMENEEQDSLAAMRRRQRFNQSGNGNFAGQAGGTFGRRQNFAGASGFNAGGDGFAGQNGAGRLPGGQGFRFSENGAGAQRLGAGFAGAGMGGGRGDFRRARVPGRGQAAGMAGLPGARKPLDLRPLNLSDGQKQRIRDIRAQTRFDARALRSNLQDSQKQLRSLLFSPAASDSQIRQARRQLRDAQDRLDDLNLSDWLQMRKVLTAEQRQRLPMVAPGMPGNRQGAQLGNAQQPAGNQ